MMRRMILPLAVFLAAALPLRAQDTKEPRITITGKIMDPMANCGVPNVTVTVNSCCCDAPMISGPWTGKTDENGVYSVTDIPFAGIYSLEAWMPHPTDRKRPKDRGMIRFFWLNYDFAANGFKLIDTTTVMDAAIAFASHAKLPESEPKRNTAGPFSRDSSGKKINAGIRDIDEIPAADLARPFQMPEYKFGYDQQYGYDKDPDDLYKELEKQVFEALRKYPKNDDDSTNSRMMILQRPWTLYESLIAHSQTRNRKPADQICREYTDRLKTLMSEHQRGAHVEIRRLGLKLASCMWRKVQQCTDGGVFMRPQNVYDSFFVGCKEAFTPDRWPLDLIDLAMAGPGSVFCAHVSAGAEMSKTYDAQREFEKNLDRCNRAFVLPGKILTGPGAGQQSADPDKAKRTYLTELALQWLRESGDIVRKQSTPLASLSLWKPTIIP